MAGRSPPPPDKHKHTYLARYPPAPGGSTRYPTLTHPPAQHALLPSRTDPKIRPQRTARTGVSPLNNLN